MTPTFSTLFKLFTKVARVTDTFDYSGITASAIYGNVTAKIGNVIFHQNTNFNGSADIVYGSNTFVDFDLPLNADGSVRQTGYEFTYEVEIVNQQIGTSSADVGADTFTTVTIPSNPTLAASVNALVAAGTDCRAVFNVGNANGYQILSATNTTLVLASTTISGAGSGLTSVIVKSTNTFSTTTNYDFCDITPSSDLCVTSDCFYATLTAQDSTPYPATVDVDSRALTINWPRLANGFPVEAAVTTGQASQTIGPNIYTGGYLVTLSTDISWTQTDTLLVSNTVQGRSDYTVTCDNDICQAFTCIQAYATQYQNAVSQGARNLSQLTAQNFQILIYCNLYNLAIECQQTSQAQQILTDLAAYMNDNGITVSGCGCGCGGSSSTSTEPTLVTPLYNTATYNHATETAAGIIEIATQAETNAGTDDTRAITPLKLSNYVGDAVRPASETVAGIAKIATQSEVNTGTDDTKIVSPLKLQNKVASESEKGIAYILTSSAATNINLVDTNSNNDTKIVTLKKLALAINDILTRILVFTNKVFFQKGINLVGVPTSIADGDIYYDNAVYNGKQGSLDVTFITSQSLASESSVGVAALATPPNTILGAEDTTIVTPFSLQAKLLSHSNTATGTGTATLNAANGVIAYSTPLSSNTGAFYTLTNNQVTANSIVFWSLQHTVTSTENPIACYYQVQANTITFKIFNNGSATANGLKIAFTILNPGV